MATIKELLFGKKKPESFAERMLDLTVTTRFSHEEIEKLMNVSGMNIEEAEIIVRKYETFDTDSLETLIDDVKEGVYNWKELI